MNYWKSLAMDILVRAVFLVFVYHATKLFVLDAKQYVLDTVWTQTSRPAMTNLPYFPPENERLYEL